MPRILPRTLPLACVARPPDGAVQMNTPYHFQHFQPHYDAVIVGARCAGAATAMLLARAGMKVLVIDRQAYGSDTMSTHALMRTGVLQLERWGLLPAVMAAGTPEIRATTFHYGCDSLRLSIKPEHGIEHLCAPRRTVLDRILVDAARSAGADVRHGVVLSRLQIDNKGRVIGALLRDADGHSTPVRSDIVIGADGRQSTVAALVNAGTYLNGQSASGYVYGYYEDLERYGYHWHFAENVAAGVIPTNHGQHCVFAGVAGTAFPGHISRKCRGRLPQGPRGKLAASQRRCQSRSPGRPPAWLRRRPRASQAVSRPRLGARRRCRLLQRPADRPRHNRRTQGRGAAGPRDPGWKSVRARGLSA